MKRSILLCAVSNISDISGPGIRITATIIPGLGVLFRVAIGIDRFILHRRNKSFKPNLTTIKLAGILEESNNYQLGFAIAYCAYTLTIINRIDAFHLRFLLDQAILSGLSKSLSRDITYITKDKSTQLRSRAPSISREDVALHIVFTALYLATGFVFLLKLIAQQRSDPSCYLKLFYDDFIPVAILFAVMVILIQLASMLPPRAICTGLFDRVWYWLWTLTLGLLTPSMIIVITVFDFVNYEAKKMFISESEADWGVGQVLPLLFLVVAVVVPLRRGFVSKEKVPEEEQGKDVELGDLAPKSDAERDFQHNTLEEIVRYQRKTSNNKPRRYSIY